MNAKPQDEITKGLNFQHPETFSYWHRPHFQTKVFFSLVFPTVINEEGGESLTAPFDGFEFGKVALICL